MSPADSLMLMRYPVLELPEEYKLKKGKDLPAEHNNSQFPWFRPVFNQFGWSCGQASTIGYNFTYEINRAHNTAANTEDHQFTPSFPFNFFNSGENGVGVNYWCSYEAVRAAGCPTIADWGGLGIDLTLWMTGYEKYYESMLYRIDQVYTIPVGTPEGLLTLKYWLYDHLEGAPSGGLANFYTDLAGYTYLPAGTPEEGKAVITQFGAYAGHSMTFVGWNDSIRFDYNNDGQYTNDIDINGDNVVDMKDWEIGGLILVNSWGDGWADGGFCYVMYNVLAQEKEDGGIWNKQVNVFTVDADYEPKLTYKITLTHDVRNRLRVLAGVNPDISSAQPAYELEFPIFNHQGGEYYMQGNFGGNEYKTIEFGLDVTPLLSYLEPGQPARFFLKVVENDPDNMGTGSIDAFSVINYGEEIHEFQAEDLPADINENWITLVPVTASPDFSAPQITTQALPSAQTGETVEVQLSAEGGVPDYRWQITPSYSMQNYEDSYPQLSGVQLPVNGSNSGYATQQLDFPFPFFGSADSTVVVHTDGFLMFHEVPYPLPYQVDDRTLFRNERMIAPLMCQEMKLVSYQNDGIWYDGNESYAKFRWKTTVEQSGEDLHLDFTLILYPDGTIEAFRKTFDNSQGHSFITGISSGDGKHYIMAPNSTTQPYDSDPVVRFAPAHLPVDAEVTSEGWLTATMASDTVIYSIPVEVTDRQHISDFKYLQFSSGLTYTWSIDSGGDSIIQAGETAALSLWITNTGNTPVEAGQIVATSSDTMVTFQSNNSSFATLEPGETQLITDAAIFSVDTSIPEEYSFRLDLRFENTTQHWSDFLMLRAYSADVYLTLSKIIDGNNGRLDPGETASVIFTLINLGQTPVEEVTATLTTEDSLLFIGNNGLLSFGSLQPGVSVNDTITFTAADYSPEGHIAVVDAHISGLPGIDAQQELQLMIGRRNSFVLNLAPDEDFGLIIDSLMTMLGIDHDYDVSLPPQPDTYRNMFVLLGQKFNNHILSSYEADVLASFLEGGGNLYLEGTETWYYDPQTALHEMFPVDVIYTGWLPYDTLIGVPGTFTEMMKFEYIGAQSVYPNYLEPGSGAFSILENTYNGNSLMVAGENETYKTVAFVGTFNSLGDTEYPGKKLKLLAEILAFFGTEVIITGNEQPVPAAGDLSVFPNPASGKLQVMVPDGLAGVGHVSLYDGSGRLVKRFDSKANDGLLEVSLEGFPHGIGFGRIDKGSSSLTFRFIRQ
ncbi:MAG: hypothetical protein Kow00127_18680 [Bacteroidales bacterium]